MLPLHLLSFIWPAGSKRSAALAVLHFPRLLRVARMPNFFRNVKSNLGSRPGLPPMILGAFPIVQQFLLLLMYFYFLGVLWILGGYLKGKNGWQ
jgi:hypothetical protein